MIKNLILIGLGGFIGSIFRYLVQLYISTRIISSIPYGTLTVNVIGSFLVGILVGLTYKLPKEWVFLLSTGFCGGFTTFSTFSAESFNLMSSDDIYQSFFYIFLSLGFGIFAAYLGIITSKIL